MISIAVTSESAKMALSYFLQPKLRLRVCRLYFSAASARFSSSVCSNGDNDNPPRSKKEAAGEDPRIMAMERYVKKFGYMGKKSGDVMARNDGSNTKRLAILFREHKDDQTGIMAEDEGRKPEAALSDYQHVGYEWGQMSSPSNSSQEVLDVKESSKKSTCDRAALEIDKPRSPKFTYKPPEHSNEPSGDDAEKNSSKSLRLQEDIQYNSTNCHSSKGLIKDNSLNANLQKSDNNDGLNLVDFPAATPSIKDMETSVLDFNSIDFKELKECLKVSVPTSNKDHSQSQETRFARIKSEENKVLLRFLQSHITKRQIFECFNSCGEILKVEGPYALGPLFKTAYIDFKTREGFEKALKRSGLLVHNAVVIVESATKVDEKTLQIPIPSLLGDPDIPAALVKNPTRTIKIERLTHEISSRHIEEALAFCKSNISGYSLGSSHSVAYVEFETEIGKERALAKQSINVFGRHLVMLRIDCPRTTVVRISNMDSLKVENIMSICKSLGDISLSVPRGLDMLDVHFKIAEWPNMLKILNRLNGSTVEGRRLQAEPAPVFPPDVLLALWHHAEERKRLKATAQVLLHKLVEKTLDASELSSLENDIFCI